VTLVARVLRNSGLVVLERAPHLPETPGVPHSEPPGSLCCSMPLKLRTPPPPPRTRASITARCAVLMRERSDLDPTGPAYEAKSLQLDAALAALWALGPPEGVPA
jgi:hypothetical protein